MRPEFIFRPSTRYVFVDGSNDPVTTFNYFRSPTNTRTILDWLSNGGKLFVNIGVLGAVGSLGICDFMWTDPITANTGIANSKLSSHPIFANAGTVWQSFGSGHVSGSKSNFFLYPTHAAQTSLLWFQIVVGQLSLLKLVMEKAHYF